MGSTRNYYIVNFVNVNSFRQLTAAGKDAKFILRRSAVGLIRQMEICMKDNE